MIETFYNVTVTNVRKQTATPTSTDTVTTASSFVAFFTPVTEKAKLFVENNIGKEYDVVCDDSEDVRVGDDLYINGVKYNTLGVSNYLDRESDEDSHLEIRVAK